MMPSRPNVPNGISAATRFHRDTIAGDGRAGIDLQAPSLTAPGMRVHIDRLRGFAASPLQDPAAAAAELERAVTDWILGALVTTACSARGRCLDAPVYDEVWSALGSLGSGTSVPRRPRPSNGRSRGRQNCRGVVELVAEPRRARTAHRLQLHARPTPSDYFGTNVVFTTSGCSHRRRSSAR